MVSFPQDLLSTTHLKDVRFPWVTLYIIYTRVKTKCAGKNKRKDEVILEENWSSNAR